MAWERMRLPEARSVTSPRRSLMALEGPSSAPALLWDSGPEPGHDEFLLSKSPSLRPFAVTARGNKYTVIHGRSHWLGASVGQVIAGGMSREPLWEVREVTSAEASTACSPAADGPVASEQRCRLQRTHALW